LWKIHEKEIMLRLDFTDDEIRYIKSKIKFSERQERIIEYRRRDIEIIKMSDLEHCSPSTIDRELKRIKTKIKKVM